MKMSLKWWFLFWVFFSEPTTRGFVYDRHYSNFECMCQKCERTELVFRIKKLINFGIGRQRNDDDSWESHVEFEMSFAGYNFFYIASRWFASKKCRMWKKRFLKTLTKSRREWLVDVSNERELLWRRHIASTSFPSKRSINSLSVDNNNITFSTRDRGRWYFVRLFQCKLHKFLMLFVLIRRSISIRLLLFLVAHMFTRISFKYSSEFSCKIYSRF